MKKVYLSLLLVVLFFGCKENKKIAEIKSIKVEIEENEYGYTSTNPIKIGGVETGDGPMSERIYLKELVDLDGESIIFNRFGSCCNFPSEKGPYGQGLLDIYNVYVKGKKDTIQLYLNMYERDTIMAPKGFKFAFDDLYEGEL